MDVDRDLGPGPRLELLPGPLADERPAVLQGKGPPVERRMWRRPGAEDGEVVGQVLARREPFPVCLGPRTPCETSGRGHGRLMVSWRPSKARECNIRKFISASSRSTYGAHF